MTATLTAAIERRDWSVVSLWLLLGVSQAAAQLPPEALVALIDLLAPPQQGAGCGDD